MITLYTTPSCTSCRKAKAWLVKHGIPFKKRDFYAQPLRPQEIRAILALTENGTEDIISIRSAVYQKLKLNMSEMKLNDLCRLIQKYPSILRRPIIIDDKKIQIGYNEDDMRIFITREERKNTINLLEKELLYWEYLRKGEEEKAKV